MAARELVEVMARALAEHPEDVRVTLVPRDHLTVIELHVHPDDLGRVIGRGGRIVGAMRTVLKMAGRLEGKRLVLEVR